MTAAKQARVPESVDTLVVGGGLAGLTAAIYVAREGGSVALCERAPELGGRARTRLREGFHLNMGPHALYRKGVGAAILKELGIPYTGQAPSLKGGRLTRGTETGAFPATPMSLLASSQLSLREKASALKILASLPLLDTAALNGLTLEDWLRREKFPVNTANLLRTLIRLSSYCAESDRVSAGAVLAQLQRAAGGVHYVDHGWQSLVDGLARTARRHGVSLHTGKGVEALQSGPSGAQVQMRDGAQVKASNVILAVPIGAALELLGQKASPPLQRFANAAPLVKLASLDIGLRELPCPATVFAMDMEHPFYMSVHSNSARLAPQGQHLIQLARYGGDPDGTARAQLCAWLDRLQPGWRRHVVVERYLPKAQVMSALPAAAHKGLEGRPGPQDSGCPAILLCGDWVGNEGLLADASLASARSAALIATTQLQQAVA